ncbi:MAG: FecR domain-containing protein [Solitalea sp.]
MQLSIEQLVSDPSFRDWVLARPGADAGRWNEWERQHSDQAETIHTAKAIVLALQLKEPVLPDQEIEQELQAIREGLDGAAPRTRPIYRMTWFRVAAAVLITALGLSWFFRSWDNKAPTTTALVVENLPVSGKYENHSDTIVGIRLPDQSLVRLNRESTLAYDYRGGKREVTLEGEAFFDVFREPARPFLVHAGGIVTRVLGTSFRVRARTGENQAEVSVKTGKVYVAPENDASTALILSPNQRVKYDRDRHRMEKGLVDAPQPIRESGETQAHQELFRFEHTPLTKVFEELENAYGIPIIYDESIVASCSLSATLGDEPFFEKLRLICKVVNASYEILDGSVVIYAKGCN